MASANCSKPCSAEGGESRVVPCRSHPPGPGCVMKKVVPEDYTLTVLSLVERFEAAIKVAREAFKGASVTISDIQAAVRNVRKKVYAERQKKSPSRR